MIAKEWCRDTVNHRADIIHRMCKWGVSQELVKPEAYQALMVVERLQRGRTKAPDFPKVEGAGDNVIAKTLPKCPPSFKR